MRRMTVLALGLAVLGGMAAARSHFVRGVGETPKTVFVEADDKNIQYIGRIDFADPKKPKFWSPGVTIQARFQGPSCAVMVRDEQMYGTSHNYLEIVVDGQKPFRVQLTGAVNTIQAADGLPDGPHTVTICKDTESGIGFLEFLGFRCAGLVPLPPKPTRKLEFIGDSITCGAGSDESQRPCGQGQWYDQHNAYFSYGLETARRLNAQGHLSSVSGIGLIHSCCDMTITMPQVFDKMNLRDDTGLWDFRRYQRDAVTVSLGQNDGAQDPAEFQDAYVRFLAKIRSAYPDAQIVCLTSPMADAALTAYLKDNLTRIVARANQAGDKKGHAFFFSRSYNGGCGGHPSLAQHQLIAGELVPYLKTTLGW